MKWDVIRFCTHQTKCDECDGCSFDAGASGVCLVSSATPLSVHHLLPVDRDNESTFSMSWTCAKQAAGKAHAVFFYLMLWQIDIFIIWQHSEFVELVLSTPLGKKICWAWLCFYSQSREIQIAWVNGGRNYDFVKVAKCPVIYNRLRLASKRVWDSTFTVWLADLCGRH